MRPALLALLLPALVAGSLFAPSGADAQDRQRARQLYNEAQALFESGQYAQAEASFRAAYQAMPNPVVLRAIAAAQEQQGNITGAIETFEAYLAASPNAPDRAAVEQRLQGLRARPATVAVTSTPPGAQIIVDGNDTGQITPADVEMAPGEHTVELRLTGYSPATQTFTAQAATRVRLEVPLTAGGGSGDPMGSNGGDGQGASGGDGGDGGGNSDDPSIGVWVTAGIAAAALVSGTVFGFLALSEQSNFDAEPANDIADRGEAFALVADISFGVAAALAITAIVLYIVERSDGGDSESAANDGPSLTLAPFASPTGGGGAAQLRF